jgi:PncC family amidohydrolase
MTLIEQLKNKKLTLSFAESMTGGALASYITQFKGASQVFKGSLVCYDPDIKINVLGISQSLINTYGVVSHEVCEAMVEACHHMFQSSISVSVTGYAEGDEKDIYIGIKYHETILYHLKRSTQTRTEMIHEVVQFIYEKIHEKIMFV